MDNEQTRALQGDPAPDAGPTDQQLREGLRRSAAGCLVLASAKTTSELASAALVSAAADAVRAAALLRYQDLGEDLRRAVAGAEDLARADVEAAEAQRDRLARFLRDVHGSGIGLDSIQRWLARIDSVDLSHDVEGAVCRALADQILTPKAPT